MAAWIKIPLGMELGLSSGEFVIDGDPALPSPERGQSPTPQFSAHFCCGQTAACIKMRLGMEVGLSPGDCVRWGHSPLPQFLAHFYCGQMAACIKMPLGMEVSLSPGDCVRCDPAPLNFRPMFIIVIVISLEHSTMHNRYWFVEVKF